MKQRKDLMMKVDQLVKEYCDGCFLYRHIRKEEGRTAAHRFCITQCTVGEKFVEIGKNLS
ncbi:MULTISPECIES: zinc-finger domain-containing protein [unclassified Bacillus (in: firmicutes)]|uniref:zinc-finger domain-containing protein n=1 Tax=unclassified Bacillus (in: firmicutes) TaxID=185979 RepID=UPI0008E94CF2|nr:MULTISPECIES: zinc-finger domain-containing protein [unclassified Bacillus (in: firmicutes)]SFA99421.1 Protein of unknown function [Bacillus sp. UNCCL13]SFQ81625.1 Protein of unknown function [Bacillus sp. cl95]